MDSGEKVSGGLVIAGRYSAELLELADEILDEMACLVDLPVENMRRLTAALGRDDRGLASRQEGLDHARIGIEGVICEYGIGFHLRSSTSAPSRITHLTAGQADNRNLSYFARITRPLGQSNLYLSSESCFRTRELEQL